MKVRVFEALCAAQRKLSGRLELEIQRQLGLSLSELQLLDLLSGFAQGRRMNDLAEATGMSPSGLSRLVDRLVAYGLITRFTCPSDHRGFYAVITGLGEAKVRVAGEIRSLTLDAMLDEDNWAALDQAVSALEAIIN